MSKWAMAFVGASKDDRLLAADSFSGSCGCVNVNTNGKSEKKGDKWHYCQTPISQIKSTKILKGK